MQTKVVLPKDENGRAIEVLSIGHAQTVTNTSRVLVENGIIRVKAESDVVRLWMYLNEKKSTNDGVLLYKGDTEYFAVAMGHTLEVEGTANIMG